MAPPAGTLRVGRYFLALVAILVVLYGLVFWPGARHTPKLGLDLVGGTQVIFTAKAPGGKTPSSSSMSQAKQIMTERVNGSGVTEATVVVQGSDQIVISIPGSSGADVSKLGAAAVLNFRGLAAPIVPVTCMPKSTASTGPAGAAKPKQGSAAKPDGAAHRALDAAAPTPSGTASSPGPTSVTSPTCTAKPFAALEKKGLTIPTSAAAYQKLSQAQQQQIQAALANYDCAAAQNEPDIADKYFVACDDGSRLGQPYAYLLGTVIVPGKEISSAEAVAPNPSAGQLKWTVALNLKSSGQTAWAKYTGAHNVNGDDTNANPATCGPGTVPCADFVAFTLDGVVISSPVNLNAINGGKTQITGNFTQDSAKDLAQKLKYGALPLSFKAQQAQEVSATLGSSQLKSGMLAGGIGLALVIIYSLLYYRALGLVTIASLGVSGLLVYASIVVLGVQMGLTLSLAGIAGFIVAVGITADSFVVFFERIKDEVHEGRSAKVAIPRAWVRARRTILSADTVSVLAAAILYYFAAGDVKGFAFTLGLSTVLDLIVVFLFTHPLVSLLSRLKAFGSKRITGLDAVRANGVPTAPQSSGRRARGARAARRAASVSDDAATDTTATEKTAGGGAVAVLEREDEQRAGDALADADESTIEHPPAAETDSDADADTTSESAQASDEDDGSGDAAGGGGSTRRHTTPAAGTAAERAAARRARMRERSGEEGGA